MPAEGCKVDEHIRSGECLRGFWHAPSQGNSHLFPSKEHLLETSWIPRLHHTGHRGCFSSCMQKPIIDAQCRLSCCVNAPVYKSGDSYDMLSVSYSIKLPDRVQHRRPVLPGSGAHRTESQSQAFAERDFASNCRISLAYAC